MGEPARAVKLYKLAYLANPGAPNDAVYRAAQVCDNDLSEYEHAAHYYWLAAKQGKSLLTRKQAAFRLGQLQKKDFGTSYSLDEKAAEPAAEPANAGRLDRSRAEFSPIRSGRAEVVQGPTLPNRSAGNRVMIHRMNGMAPFLALAAAAVCSAASRPIGTRS